MIIKAVKHLEKGFYAQGPAFLRKKISIHPVKTLAPEPSYRERVFFLTTEVFICSFMMTESS